MGLFARCVWMAVFLPSLAQGGGVSVGIDHAVALDDRGIWARRNQQALLGALLAGELGGAVWEGGETRIGRTLWQSIDATVVGGGLAFSRPLASAALVVAIAVGLSVLPAARRPRALKLFYARCRDRSRAGSTGTCTEYLGPARDSSSAGLSR